MVSAAELDPVSVQQLSESLDDLLAQKNRTIEDLQFQVIRVTKAHNDAVRVMEAKLLELGVPESELEAKPILGDAVTTPANLVSAVL